MSSESVWLSVAGEEHAVALAEFFRQVWDPGTTALGILQARRSAAAANFTDPGQPPPAFLALHGERVVGFLGSLPARFWNGTVELPGYWLKGLMVLPEYRGGPIGYSVLREATRSLPRSAALTVAPAARRLFGALGFKDIGAIPNFVRVLRGGRMAARIDLAALGIERGPAALRRVLPLAQRTGLAWLGGSALGGALRLRAALGRTAAAGFRRDSAGLPPGSELDALWADHRVSLRAGAVRDGNEMAFRYGSLAGSEAGRYRVASVRRGSRLAGVAVVREARREGDPRLKGIALASLSDLWFDPLDAAAGLATLGAAEATARSLGADALLCSSGHARLGGLLRRQGYVETGGNMHLLLRDVTEAASAWPLGLDQWWITRGDARSDEVF